MFPELKPIIPVEHTPQKNETYYFPTSPSLLEYLDEPPEEIVTEEQVVATLRGTIAHQFDNFFVQRTGQARKFEKSDEALERVPLRAEQDLVKWKARHVFLARPPRTTVQPKVEGTIFSAQEVEKMWNYNPTIMRLESQIVNAHKAHLNGRNRFLSETHPLATTHTEVLKIINADFGDFGSQVRLRYDYIILHGGKIIIIDQKYTSEDPYDRTQVLLYSLFANTIAKDVSPIHEFSKPKPIKVNVEDQSLANVEFWYRTLNKNFGGFRYQNRTLKGQELQLAMVELNEKLRRWNSGERDKVLEILEKRRPAFVRPHIPDSKDFTMPAAPRLVFA